MWTNKKKVVGYCQYCHDKVYTTDKLTDDKKYHLDCFVKESVGEVR